MADLIDPFDDPGQQLPPQQQNMPGLVDPFDAADYYQPTQSLTQGGDLPGEYGRPISVDDKAQSASFWTTLKASLHPDEQKKIETFAQGRGVNINRYGVDREGNVVYLNDQGQVVREIPSVAGASGVADLLGRMGQFLGFHTGENIPQAAAAGVGLAMGPTGLSIPAAGATAGIVDVGRQALANALTGHEGIDLMNSVGQGALAMTGQGATAGINRMVSRNPMKVGGHDIQTLRDPARMDQFMDDSARAQRQGITVTPGEVTGARSLLQRQRQLGRFEESTDILDEMYKKRIQEEIPDAFNRMTSRISPQGSATVGARNLAQGATDTIEALKGTRSQAASKFYESAFNSGAEPDIAPVMNALNNRVMRTANKSEGRKQLEKIRGMLQREVKETDEAGKEVTRLVPEVDYRRLHNAKLNIDRMIDDVADGKLSLDKDTNAALVDVKTELTQVLRDTHPDYEQGYQAFIANSPPVDEASKGIMGLASRERASNFRAVPQTMFGSGSDTMAIRSARRKFEQAGQMDQWNEGLRSFLDDTFAQAQKREGVGKETFKLLYKDPRQRANLKAAMDPPQWNAFEDLMKTLEMVARAPAEGSPTATDMLAKQDFAGPAAKSAGTALKGISLDIFPRLGQWIEDLSAGRNAGAIAELITQPNAVQELKKLRVLKPGSQKALTIIDDALATAGLYAAGGRTLQEQPIGSFAP